MHRGDTSRRSARAGRAFVLAIAATIVAAFGVAACGDGDDKTSSSSTSTTAKVGDTLTIANPAFPPSLDPATGNNPFADYYSLVYDPLLLKTSDGSYKPGLALTWEYGPNNESFSLTLRPNVKFSDGATFDAEAVKTWINHAIKLPGGSAATYLNSLKTIDVTGPLALTLRFSEPTPLLEKVLSQELQIGLIGSPKAVAAKTLATTPAGTGPYMLDKASTVARDHYTFVPSPTAWNKSAVHWRKVVIKTITNPTAALQALKTGQAQVAKDQPVTSLDTAKSAGLKFVAPLTLLMGLALNDRDGKVLEPLGDVRVRQAINYAIDRESINKVLGAGYGRVTGQMAVPGDDAYDPELDKRYPYDLDKAKQLMAEAGYEKGFTLPVVSVNVVGQDKVAEALGGQLSKIGITVKADVKTSVGEYFEGLAGGKFPAATTSWGRLPAVTNYQLLWGPNASGSNPFKTTDPALDELYQKLIAAPPESADQFARETQKFLVEQAWFAPVSATPLVALYSKDVTGVNATAQRNGIYVQEIRPS